VCIILRPLWILEIHFAWKPFLHRLLELSPPCFVLSFRGPWIDLIGDVSFGLTRMDCMLWSRKLKYGHSWFHFVYLVTSNPNCVSLPPADPILSTYLVTHSPYANFVTRFWPQLILFCLLGPIRAQLCYPGPSWSHYVDLVISSPNFATAPD
jgi:hypothetical protein